MPLSLADFDYELPPELIAQFPLPERTASRLLVVDGARREDRRFADLPGLLHPGDLLVFNDTRVLRARLHGVKDSGGRVEVLIERPVGRHEALAQIRASQAPWPGSRLRLEGRWKWRWWPRREPSSCCAFPPGRPGRSARTARQAAAAALHPARRRNTDEARYQTVYAAGRGSVAAPTAGLHFDQPC
jgi:S-adenosylmethionine:tRNA ribosyltransferase-isomerase